MSIERFNPEVSEDWRGMTNPIAVMARSDRGRYVKFEDFEAVIKRQAGASETLRKLTLDEVQHLKDKDRTEYAAGLTLESEREANAILTDEVERLTAALSTAHETLKVTDEFLTVLQTPNSEPLNSINGGDKAMRSKFTAQLRNDAREVWALVGNTLNGHIDPPTIQPTKGGE